MSVTEINALMAGRLKRRGPAVVARGRPRPSRGKNALERRYERHLQTEHAAGRVLWFAFEGVKLRLADRTWYTPDFVVLLTDMTLELHEVKGHWEDDARVKIKVAAELFPLRFIALTPAGKRGWNTEIIPGVE